MLTCFDLKSGHTIDEFQSSLAEFTAQMRDAGLVHSCGPVGKRQRHPVMDTDSERDHEFFFIMSFEDRAQCDRAVQHVLPNAHATDSLHSSTYSLVDNPIFVCWADIDT